MRKLIPVLSTIRSLRKRLKVYAAYPTGRNCCSFLLEGTLVSYRDWVVPTTVEESAAVVLTPQVDCLPVVGRQRPL